MGQMVFTFYSPMDVPSTADAIERVVRSMKGKCERVRDTRIDASWRPQSYHSVQRFSLLSSKCSFYIGSDVVRAVMNVSGGEPDIIWDCRDLTGAEIAWNAFIESLQAHCPDVDFGLKPGLAYIDAIQIVSDGITEVFTSTACTRPSWGRALLGSMLFGTVGAIVGGMSGRTDTTGVSNAQFSDELLAVVRYTNGLTFEGQLIKRSPAYNEVMANMSRLSKQVL